MGKCVFKEYSIKLHGKCYRVLTSGIEITEMWVELWETIYKNSSWNFAVLDRTAFKYLNKYELREKMSKKNLLIVAFAFSVLLNIIFMMNFNTRKEQLLYSLCGDLQNISQVLDNIKVELESTEDSVCSDYNRYALKVCCEKFDIRMEELCNGLSPIYDYARPVSFSRLYNIEFTEAIKEKDIYTIAFYITAINELIEELSNQEENNSLLYNDVTKSMNYSLMLRKIIDKFEFFDEQIRIGSKDLRND